MDVGQATQGTPSPVATESAAARRAISSDFETFLKMLTAQMENQDPLNPIESSDYAVQLATFSGVEQQVRSNELLEQLGQKMGLMGMAQLAGWVGMEARAPTPGYFSGSPMTLAPGQVAGADLAVLVVRDANGVEVNRGEVPTPARAMEWAGVGADGTPLAPGVYSFELESYGNGDLLSVDPVEVYSRVTEARNEGGETVLILEGGFKVPASSVNALRSPPAAI